ncbi:MAG: KilA-N domain-containing protein [Sulfurimonas sp.]|nr:KilA-N domain-containing protein [Sulfurimonas sp.]MDD5203758.1 KilA-N domain-containing protein [Sulfurimonas sp.]
MAKIQVLDKDITIIKVKESDYISLTDMLRAKDGDFFISDWLRNRNTVEYLGVWEKIYNPDFNYGEFAIIKSQVGLNSYKISVKEWTEKTNAIGLVAKAGRYGGTYAHSDIAFEFGMWISAEFKIYLIKEFQRLKSEEQKQLGWDIRRNLTKINYKIHTDAIKNNLIPKELNKTQTSFVYASEADVLNVALFGMTANQWRDNNKNTNGNIRDEANAAQLVCLANLEAINALLLNEAISQEKRLIKLNSIARQQMHLLMESKQVSALEEKI